MKAYSKFLSLIIAFMLIFSTISVSAKVTNVETGDKVSLKWATQIGSGWQKPAGVPILVNDNIVIMSGDELLVVDRETGNVTKSTTMAEAQSYGYVAPTFADNKIFANLSSGTVQAFNSETLESLWVYTDSLGGKGMTGLTYSEKTVYTAFWNGETKDASFVALDSETGKLKWQMIIDGGLYWAGAYCTDDAVIFATDDGTDKIAHIYSCDKTTGEIISQTDIENKGDIRSSISYYNGRIYVTTKSGYLVSADLTNNKISDVKYGEIGAASTSTPVIHNGRIFIGASDKTISVFDADTLGKIFSVPIKGYPQCTPLLSTAYEESEGYVYLYTTYNTTPGGVTLIKIKSDATSAEDCIVTELYDADGYSQYCISDIISDKDGTLYYKNDSGYLFALEQKNINVRASLAYEGFVFPQTELKVNLDLAEIYGYTDNVTDAVSALDLLVKIHENMFGEEFNFGTATDYLMVSAEGYLSRIMGIDTYNFGFAVNGEAPHDAVLTQYGYTGYTLNQAAVKEGDKVEFFLYRDSWAMDNYVHFEKDGTSVNYITVKENEEFNIKLQGYTYAWYSCYEDSQIENMMTPITNANIILINPKTGVQEKVIAVTDEAGLLTLSFNRPGKYVISAVEDENDYPLIAPWLVVEVEGIDVEIDSQSVRIISNLKNQNNFIIFIAEYNDNMLNDVIILVPDFSDNYEDVIDISNLSGEIKVFLWDENMQPISEVE